MFARLRERWPLLVAAVFCIYSVLLLANAFHAQDQLKAATATRLIADSKRRAAAVADFVAKRRSAAHDIASANEIDNYLSSKALGMSARYGLNAMLDVIEQRFRNQVEVAKANEGVNLRRIAFLDADGRTLVDTATAEAPIKPEPPGGASALTIDTRHGRIIVAAPVVFKGDFSGTLVTQSLLSDVYRHLLQVDDGGSYHETLLSADGREIASPGGSNLFSPQLIADLLKLPADRAVALDSLDLSALDPQHADSIAIKTPVPGLPLFVVTTVGRKEIYGQLGSSLFLYSAGIFPVLVLLAALLLDRSQRRARRAEVEASDAHNQRRELQGENVALAAEISRREAVEAELQQHREHLEELVAQRTAELDSLFHALPDLYFRIAPDGTILDYRAGNDSALYLAPHEFLGKRMQDLLPANVAEVIAGAMRRLADGEPLVSCEYALPMPSGLEYFEARMVVLDGGQIVIVVRNITERRMVDASREANRREAERLARVKSEFLANMSHEIRTPLNGVLGMAQIGYRDSEGRSNARRAFAQILESGKLLLGIINDILDFSKIEAGKLGLEQLVIAPAQLIDQAVEVVAERARTKEVALVVVVADDLPEYCLGDPLRLVQILMNLLSNAVKFTERGSVEIGAARDGDWLLFSVTDTGIGMSPEHVSRLFNAFEQLDGSTTRKFGGTGLGLAISGRLAKLMNGEIRVHSSPGLGSRFELRVPLIPAAAPAPVTTSDAGLAPAAGKRRLAGLSVLVAEDVIVNQLVIEAILEGEGARVDLVGDGRQALERVVQLGPAAFDIVLMDIEMPHMDGFEATRRICAVAPGLPVVGQTAHAMTEDREDCLASGMVDHVAKPIEIEQLVAVLLRHAGSRKAARPTASAAGTAAAD